MNVWQTFVTQFFEVPQKLSPAVSNPAQERAALALGICLALLVIFEDWRLLLLLWAGAGLATVYLLLSMLPPAWALGRLIAVAIAGMLLWLGGRRRPRQPFRPGYGVVVRLPVTATFALLLWQAQPYLESVWPHRAYANAAVLLDAAGLFLVAFGGGTIRTVLGWLLWVDAAYIFLAWWRVPTGWVWGLALLEAAIWVVGGMLAASEGVWAREQLAVHRRRAPRARWHGRALLEEPQ